MSTCNNILWRNKKKLEVATEKSALSGAMTTDKNGSGYHAYILCFIFNICL